jgi:hypothetical protein
MVLADSSYPLLNLFWTMCILFLWVIWIWILIWVFIDIFRSHDLSGGAKALWFVFVLFIPVIGVLVYLIARGGSMSDRAAGRGLAVGPGFCSCIQQAAAGLPASAAGQPTTSWQRSATRESSPRREGVFDGFQATDKAAGDHCRSGDCTPRGQEGRGAAAGR